ncbi:hypothetical protein [Cohnella terricola]|uniref:Uncharacterized protein n=1 Tax=Cohnella terricola TaxID=1289167 RepID=A0A559J9G6_9BACL|nr:hypothetical protein [Cohnella terricola]TVX96487.1 hypothetical protein FPZ45_21025 [Cohnella terricola]
MKISQRLRFLLLCVALLGAMSGCGKPEKNYVEPPSPSSPAIEDRSEAFTIEAEHISKISLLYGDGTQRFELTSQQDFEELLQYFNSAELATGALAADHFGTFQIQYQDGNVDSLEITGTVSAFQDSKTNRIYMLNHLEKRLDKWAEEKERAT